MSIIKQLNQHGLAWKVKILVASDLEGTPLKYRILSDVGNNAKITALVEVIEL